MALNIITAKFCSGATQSWASEAWQYDYGQVLQFDGLELPEAYQVHFSNVPMTGTAITQIGGADGVTVPDQYFATGEPVYAWVYLHEGEDDGETVYMVTIPVKKRPQPSDEVPTPEEQSAIDQAIAALNIAVEKADEAITHYPTIIDGTWHVWDVTTEAYVDTGVQAQGAKGDKGNKGDNGISPTVTVTDITNGHRVTITDADGMKTFDVMNGAQGDPGGKGDPGAPGTSPTVTVTEITGGHRVTITDESGEHTFDVLDGEDGSAITVDPALSPTSENPVQNKVITQELTDVKDNLNQLQTDVNGKVDDVQIDGTSIVTDGVAAIPFATLQSVGLISIGTGLVVNNTTGEVSVSNATSDIIKVGTDRTKFINARLAYAAAFYGLAKAAGDTTQSQSSNAVGQYTDEAKAAIQQMLGIDTGVITVEQVSGTTPTINGIANMRYVCGEVQTIDITPPSTGTIDVIFESGTTPALLTVPSTVVFPDWFDYTDLEANRTYEINIAEGKYGAVMSWAV